MRAELGEEVREHIEVEIVESFHDEHGPLGLELAFVPLERLDRVVLGLVLRCQMLERRGAAKRREHGDDAIVAAIII